MAMATAGHFYELADTVARVLHIFHSREELAEHVKDNPRSMFMRVFQIPMKFAFDGSDRQGVIRVRAGDPEEVSIDDVLKGEA